MASALSRETNPGTCGLGVSLEPQWGWWEALGWALFGAEHGAFCFLPVEN